jgi:hypothetical protein
MRATAVIVFAFALATPQAGRTQSAPTPSAVSDSASAAETPAPQKKGLFGKIKGLAKNKVVKTVAKAALCTAVPGGQVIASALDAADTKNAAGVAGAAAGVAGGGGNCMPGMPGMAGNGMPPTASGVAAVAGVAAPGIPSMPTTGIGGAGMSVEQMQAMQKQYQQMGMDSAQLAAMQQMMAAMPGAAAAATAPAGPAAGPASLDGLGPALSLEKGRMVLRQLPWIPGSDALRTDAGPSFGLAVHQVALAMQATATRYKVEARVEDQGNKDQNRLLSQKRAAVVIAGLTAEGIAPARLSVSDGGADKDVRIVVSETK